MSVKVVNSGPGEIKITASTTPAISVTQPSVNVVNVNPLITGIGTGPTGPTGAQGPAGANGQGVPAGGSTNQVLLKSSGSDYATAWGNVAYANVTGTPTLAAVATSGAYADVSGTPNLATVATSGAYADLTGKPTIVNNVDTNLTVTRDATSVTVASSDGTDAVLPQSSTTQAGVMSAASHQKLANLNASADVTNSSSVAAAGAVMDTDFAQNGLMRRTGSGQYDTVAASTTNIAEGTNKYYTDAKVTTLLGNTNVSALSNGSNVILTTTADVSGASFVLNQNDLGDNSATKVPTQASVKAYVNSQLSSTSGLTDVHASATQDGEILIFSTSNNKYIPRLLNAGGNVTITNTQNGISIAADATPRTVQVEVVGGATNTLQAAETLKLTPGANIALTESAGTVSIATTDAVFTNAQAQTAVFSNLSGSNGIGISTGGGGTTAAVTLIGKTSNLSDVNGDGSANGELLIYNASTNKYDTNTLNAGSNVTITEGQGTIEIAAANDNTQLSNEQVQDVVGDMFGNNTETLITATYQDSDGTIDLVVNDDLSNYSNASSGFLNASSTTNSLNDVNGSGATNGQILIYNQSSNKYQPGLINGGSNVTVTNSAGGISIASTASGGASALNDLSDVTIGSTAANQYLVHNSNSDFVNQALDISHDNDPDLGGDLDVGDHSIVTSTGNKDITLNPHGTGKVNIGSYPIRTDDSDPGNSESGQVLMYVASEDQIKLVLPPQGTVTTTGSPSNNQIATFTSNSNELDGSASLTFDGTNFNTPNVLVEKTDAQGGALSQPGRYGVGSRVTKTMFTDANADKTAGDVYVLRPGDSTWAAKAHASAEGTATAMLAVAAATSSVSGMVLSGVVRVADNTGFHSAGTGSILYLDTTAGHVTATKPTGTGKVVRIVGYVVDNGGSAGSNDGVIYFDPSKDWIELA